jgi:intergrase/recombinase
VAPDPPGRHAPRVPSLLIAVGVPMDVVSMILGHADEKVTREVYLHIMKGPATAA